MGALNIRDIGDARKVALEDEAQRRGLSVAELVRRLLDDGLDRARRARAQAEWVEAARPGIAYEFERLDRDGPTLAEHRRFDRGPS